MVNQNGEEREVALNSIPNLVIKGTAKNFLIKIYEPFCFKKSLTIEVGEEAYVSLGKNFRNRGNSLFFIPGNKTSIVIAENCNIGSTIVSGGEESGRSLLIDKDFLGGADLKIKLNDGHVILDTKTNEPLNNTSFGCRIDEHVWISEGVLILKDAYIPKNCIIGARALVTKSKYKANCVIAGVPAKICKEDVTWLHENFTTYKITE